MNTWGIFVVGRNDAKNLFNCFISIQNQSIGLPDKIIYLDDGSTDKSIEIANFFDLDIIALQDRGFSALASPLIAQSFNFGFKALEQLNLDFIMICGASVRLSKYYVEMLIHEFQLCLVLHLVLVDYT